MGSRAGRGWAGARRPPAPDGKARDAPSPWQLHRVQFKPRGQRNGRKEPYGRDPRGPEGTVHTVVGSRRVWLRADECWTPPPPSPAGSPSSPVKTEPATRNKAKGGSGGHRPDHQAHVPRVLHADTPGCEWTEVSSPSTDSVTGGASRTCGYVYRSVTHTGKHGVLEWTPSSGQALRLHSVQMASSAWATSEVAPTSSFRRSTSGAVRTMLTQCGAQGRYSVDARRC